MALDVYASCSLALHLGRLPTPDVNEITLSRWCAPFYHMSLCEFVRTRTNQVGNNVEGAAFGLALA